MKISVNNMLIAIVCMAAVAQAETKQDYLWDALRKSAEEGIRLAPGVNVGFVLEVEASYEKKGDDEISDIKLATFEAGVEAALMPGVRGAASLLWEEGDTEPIDLDTGYIVLGGTESIPVTLTAGRLYLPFGSFESGLISDPLTLELGEVLETAAGLGYENDWLNLWVGAFAGRLHNADSIENGAASARIVLAERLTLGCAYLTDIGEAGYLDDLNDQLDAGGSYERAGAWNVFALLDLDPFTLHAEYLGAANAMEWTDAEGVMTEATPKTWSLEAGCALTEKWSFSARYEGSDDFKPDEMPEHQYGAGVSFALNAFSTLSAEYLFGAFAGKDADDRHLATTQLAVAF